MEQMPKLGGIIHIGLKWSSWKNILDSIRAKETRVRTLGDFWAAIQEIEQQLDVKPKKPDKLTVEIAKTLSDEMDASLLSAFRKELKQLINRHNMENGSDTPDFILAKHLTDCLIAFDKAVTAREKWDSRGEVGD